MTRSLISPILLFSSIYLHCSLGKMSLHLLDILWNSVFRWIYLSFSPLPFSSLLFSSQLFVMSPQTTILPFCISSSWRWFWSLPPVQCQEPLFILLQVLYLSDLISWIYFSLPLYNCKGFDLVVCDLVEWSSGFPYFLQFKSEFGNKEFMIWATISFQSCFCWLYRASPSLAAKDIINLISVLTVW